MLESPITFNGFVFNDQSKRDLNISPHYWFEVRSVDGLFSTDISSEAHPIPQATGERAGDSFRRGKTITISGWLWARSLTNLRIGQLAIEQALWDTTTKPLYFTLWGQVPVYINCRVAQDLNMTEEQNDDKMRRSGTFALRADDPRMRRQDNNTFYPAWRV